jgi:hypothetical protein
MDYSGSSPCSQRSPGELHPVAVGSTAYFYIYFSKFHFSTIFTSTPLTRKWSFPVTFFGEYLILSLPLCVQQVSLSLVIYYRDYMRWYQQITKLSISKFIHSFCYFVCLRSIYIYIYIYIKDFYLRHPLTKFHTLTRQIRL